MNKQATIEKKRSDNLTLQYRQGDVLLIETRRNPDWKEEKTEEQDYVIAQKPGHRHSHRISANDAKVYRSNKRRFIEITGKTSLSHEEHAPLHLIPGCYEIILQRQFLSKGNVSGNPSSEWHYFNKKSESENMVSQPTSSRRVKRQEEVEWYEYMD